MKYVASSISQMTDYNKYYVYTGHEEGMVTGCWYFWNGTEWLIGGDYQCGIDDIIETSSTMDEEGMPADAKAVGDMIVVSNTEPTSPNTELWIDPDTESVLVPTMDDIEGTYAKKSEVESTYARKAAVGSPLRAATASAMTDVTKIYVYTGSESGYTSGHWYYYNGSSWVDGGVYNSTAFVTDKTLTGDGEAADAKAVGDEVADLKSAFNDMADTVVVYGKNRWDISSYDSGYLGSDGSLVENASWRTTDFCYVGDLNNVIASAKNSYDTQANFTMYYLCTYNENKEFIERKWTTGSYTYAVESGVKYIRFSYDNFDDSLGLTEHMLEGGTTKTAYVPYSYTKESTIKTDKTLSLENYAADAKAVGDYLSIKHYKSPIACTLTLTSKKLLNGDTGAITDSSENTQYKVSDYVDISSYNHVLVTTEHHWGQGLYAFYDSNMAFISGRIANSGSANTQIYNAYITVPQNAKYIVIGFNYQSSFPEPFLYGLSEQKWSDYKWACIGDSLTDYNGRTSLHYFDYVKLQTGISVNNMGVSGSGYIKTTSNFMTKALQVPLDTDVVTIFGSGNDASSEVPLGTETDTGTDTLGGIINTTIDNLRSILPIVPLGIVTPTPWQGNMPYDNEWMERYSNLIVKICRLRSVKCLDLYHCSGIDPNDANVRTAVYSKDEGGGAHLDETGHKLIAPKFKELLESLLI